MSSAAGRAHESPEEVHDVADDDHAETGERRQAVDSSLDEDDGVGASSRLEVRQVTGEEPIGEPSHGSREWRGT